MAKSARKLEIVETPSIVTILESHAKQLAMSGDHAGAGIVSDLAATAGALKVKVVAASGRLSGNFGALVDHLREIL